MSFVFKVKYGNVMRRVKAEEKSTNYSFGIDMTFSKLEDAIRRIFKLSKEFQFDMVYNDKEKDEVTISDDVDITDAWREQKPKPLRVTVVDRETHRPAIPKRPVLADNPPALAIDPPALPIDPPAWAAEIIQKLDRLLLAGNENLVEPGWQSVNTPGPSVGKQRGVDGVDGSASGGSEVNGAHSGSDLEFLRRAMLLRQREMTVCNDNYIDI